MFIGLAAVTMACACSASLSIFVAFYFASFVGVRFEPFCRRVATVPRPVQLRVRPSFPRSSRHHFGVRIVQGLSAIVVVPGADALGAGSERHHVQVDATAVASRRFDEDGGQDGPLVRLRLASLRQGFVGARGGTCDVLVARGRTFRGFHRRRSPRFVRRGRDVDRVGGQQMRTWTLQARGTSSFLRRDACDVTDAATSGRC